MLGQNESRFRIRALIAFVVLVVGTSTAQTWSWKIETIDPAPSRFASIAVDSEGALHVSYASEGVGTKYAFRPAAGGRWYTMLLDGGRVGFTTIVTDKDNNPHVCYANQKMMYAKFNRKRWLQEEIAPGIGPVWYSCSIAIAEDGTPHIVWYQERLADNSSYVHYKYGVLKNGTWIVRTNDWEMQTGKWLSIKTDKKGNPHISYDSFVLGFLKYTYFDGQEWHTFVVDARSKGAYNVGMGNSLVLDKDGNAHISFHDDNSVRYAYQVGDHFKVENIAPHSHKGGWQGWHTSLVMDSAGQPHVIYDDDGSVKHAWKSGGEWHVQAIVPAGSDTYRYPVAGIDKNDSIYIVYRDPSDASLKIATGTKGKEAEILSVPTKKAESSTK